MELARYGTRKVVGRLLVHSGVRALLEASYSPPVMELVRAWAWKAACTPTATAPVHDEQYRPQELTEMVFPQAQRRHVRVGLRSAVSPRVMEPVRDTR